MYPPTQEQTTKGINERIRMGLGLFWTSFGVSWAVVVQCWGSFGVACVIHLVGLFEASWTILGQIGDISGPFWAMLGHLGTISALSRST